MHLLLIEDEPEFIVRMQQAVEKYDMQIFTPEAVGLQESFKEGESSEEQLIKRLVTIQQEYKIDLVLLDTDLSRMGNGISQSACRQAFQELGMPVCRYSKRPPTGQQTKLRDLKRLAQEGASAVWVPHHLLDDLPDQLIPWLSVVQRGFEQLRISLEQHPGVLKGTLGPAGILAAVLRRPNAKADFLGYTAQNFFFFGAPIEGSDGSSGGRDIASQATRLGYWLLNYILAFPGPILGKLAAAAFLNLRPSALENDRLQELIKPAKYSGPFHDLDDFYWRDDLGKLLEEFDGDISLAPTLKGLDFPRIDADNPYTSAYLCVLSQDVIAGDQAAANPDWIPAGAQLTRIRRDLYDKLGPMLSV